MKKYILVGFFLINFVLVFQNGKLSICVGMNTYSQSYNDEYVTTCLFYEQLIDSYESGCYLTVITQNTEVCDNGIIDTGSYYYYTYYIGCDDGGNGSGSDGNNSQCPGGGDPCSNCGSCYCNGSCQDPPETPKPKDCAGVEGGSAYTDKCGHCVGGSTRETACVEDCAGVWGGKAYTKICEGQTICIDGNVGVFNNTLIGSQLAQFNQAKNDMLINCLRTSLLNNLNSNYGISISSGTGSPGSFNPCSYSISFNSNSNIDTYTLTGEFFHAYQEQFLNGKLSLVQADIANNHIGGSNIEFEEKAMNIMVGYLGAPSAVFPGTEKLADWCYDFFSNHPIHSNVTLTQTEIANWFEALEYFRNYCITNGYTNFYVKPIDYTILPTSLLSLWSLSNCIY